MAGYPTVFANLAAGNEPLSLFDTMFTIAGQQGNLPCTATGTNAITATVGTNIYLPASYTNAQLISFKAVATSTGSVTLQLGGLGFVKLFTPSGVQAASGDIVLNTHYAVQYWSDLDSGNGGFIILNSAVPAIANPVQGNLSNLNITVTTNSQATATCNAVIVQNVSGGTVRLTTFSVTLNTGTSGANGIDTGSVAASQWYAVYAIYNATSSTAAGLLSLSATSPTLPSGYTYFARLGWVATDANPFLLRTIQIGKSVQYVITATASTTSAGGNTPFPIIIATGTAGTMSTTSPVLAAFTVTGNGFMAPSTAAKITVLVNNKYKGSGPTNVIVAPNINYGGTNNGPEGSNGQAYPAYLNSAVGCSVLISMVVESSSIGVAILGAGGAVSGLGYEDNL